MTTQAVENPHILTGKKLTAVRVGWWVLFSLYLTFSAFHWQNLYKTRAEFSTGDWVYSGIQLIAILSYFFMAVYIFIKKSDDWSVIPVTVLFFTLGALPESFWLWVLRSLNVGGDINYAVSLLSVPFRFFSSWVIMGVFLKFPSGQWISEKARRVFIWVTAIIWGSFLFVILISLLINKFVPSLNYDAHFIFTELSYYPNVLIEFIAGFILFRHFRKLPNSLARQKIKWVVIFFAARAFLSIIELSGYAVGLIFTNDLAYEISSLALQWSYLTNFGMMLAFSIAIFRYRIWDIGELVSKALLYSGLTGALSLFGLVSIALLNFLVNKITGEASGVWGVMIGVLPVTAAFNPIKDRLQGFVDQHFKPEEIDFGETFIEFRTDVHEMIGNQRLTEIVAKQVKKQVGVAFAEVHLVNEIDNLDSIPVFGEEGKFAADEWVLSALQGGQVVIGEEGDAYSMIVPLVVARPRIPDVLGVLILGSRLSGMGYSTSMIESLQKLGEDVGQILYLSYLNNEEEQNLKEKE